MATLRADEVIQELERLNGNVSAVARRFKVARNTLYKFIREHPTVAQAFENARESMLDNVESLFYNTVLEGNVTAMIFWLKTQGKGRGWVERQEITGPEGQSLAVNLKWEHDNADSDAS